MAADFFGLLRHIIANYPGTSAIGSRVYPVRIPNGVTLPALAYQRISGGPVNSHDGHSGLSGPRYQLVIADDDYATARRLANQCHAALEAAVPVHDFGVRFSGWNRGDTDIEDYEETAERYEVTVDGVAWVAEL